MYKLTDEQAGKLLKSFLAYHSDQELNLDPMLDLVFFSFKAQFERDLVKYKTIVERNKNNGLSPIMPANDYFHATDAAYYHFLRREAGATWGVGVYIYTEAHRSGK